jgi:hypothetical protein
MNRQRRRRVAILILLIISIGNYGRIVKDHEVRTVEALTLLAIGALAALLIREFAEKRNDQ